MNYLNTKKIMNKMLGQEFELPQSIRQDWQKDIDLYALIDLDEQMQFCERWLVLSQDEIVIYEVHNDGRLKQLVRFKASEVVKIREIASLSCTTFIFVRADDQPPLAVVRFTQRQKQMLHQMKYVIEQIAKDGSFAFPDEFDANHEYGKVVTKAVVEAQNSVEADGSKTLWRLISYLKPYRKQLIVGSAGAVLTTLVSLVPAYVSGRLIDDVVRPFQDGSLSFAEASQVGWILVASMAVTYALREFFIWVRLNKMSILGERVAMDLRKELYAHLQTLEVDYFSKKQTGSIISRVSSDTDRIWDFIAFGVVEFSISVIMLLGLSGVLIGLDWRLGLTMALPVPVFLLCIYWHSSRMERLFINAWRKWADVTAVLSDTIPGIMVVKAFAQEKKEVGRFNKRNEVVTEQFNVIHDAWTKFWPILMLGIHMVLIVVWAMAMPRLLEAEGQAGALSAGTFVSFLLYMTMFIQPIEIIGQVTRMLNRALSSARRIFEVLDTRGSIVETENPVKLEQLKGDVKFENVYFSYDGLRYILKGMNFHVKAGEMIGLVGSSGGGKSTITKLISRFYDINSGRILIDGIDLKEIALGPYRRQVGMVLQEPYLFHGTIWENIAYGVEGVTKKEVIEAAKVANAHDFICKLAYGYDTLVGERGHNLSGGERQRVSIARAVLANPRILILDEATSAVDTETEHKIQEALDRLVEGRTVFAIAHRLSTLRMADRIFVIGEGGIVEQGTHSDLLAKEKGEYAKLCRLQQEMNHEFI